MSPPSQSSMNFLAIVLYLATSSRPATLNLEFQEIGRGPKSDLHHTRA